MFLAVAVFLVTIACVLIRPRGIGIGWWASAGAAVALLTGLVSRHDALTVGRIIWNATLTLIGIIVVSSVLNRAGFFRWAALHVARWSRGSPLRLFVLTILLGAGVSVFFSNDGTAVILTPIIFEMLAALGLTQRGMLPFVMATGFVADSMSLPLVVSNLMNIITADFFGIGFAEYARAMLAPGVVSLVASIVMLLLVYRRALPERIDLSVLPEPAGAIADRTLFIAGAAALLVMVAMFFLNSLIHIPISFIVLAVAGILLAIGESRRVLSSLSVLRDAPWSVVVFSLGMYIVVYGLRNAGLTDALAGLIRAFGNAGYGAQVVGTGALAAGLSSVMNNHPTVMIGALTVNSLADARTLGPLKLALANTIGCDLGPKMTPIGSLATLLWLDILDKRGLKIGWGYYLKIGLLLTPPVLLATLAALALT
ncbi:MAG: arsenic transporter [Chloroflexota bacterium]